MIRLAISYFLASLILVSQVGIPLHHHYCKGMLESVSLFFAQACKDHEEVKTIHPCCHKEVEKTCPEKDGKCCNDQITILINDIQSVAPQQPVFEDLVFVPIHKVIAPVVQTISVTPEYVFREMANDPGPPIYISGHALIYYA